MELHHHDIVHFGLDELARELEEGKETEVIARLRHHLTDINDRRLEPIDFFAMCLPGTVLAEIRILVVDDDPQIRRVMRTSLVSQGYDIDEAMTGEEAVERAGTEKYDVILQDINLPGINGLETCRRIRLRSEVPIIVMTVRDSEKDKVAALDAGADDYVGKPFSMPEMLARIRADGAPRIHMRSLPPHICGSAKWRSIFDHAA